MYFAKFSLLTALIISFNSFAIDRFSPRECLNAEYKTKIEHKGPFFGLFSHELLIVKKGCLITVSHKKYLPKEWVVDVCREPVHIKVTSAMGVDVAKKINQCDQAHKQNDTGDFCTQYDELVETLQDDGLIFAEGDRDHLVTAHGKTFCVYLLLERYLKNRIVFSRYTDVPEIFETPKEEAASLIPAPVPQLDPAATEVAK
jgi:hypothetical protein